MDLVTFLRTHQRTRAGMDRKARKVATEEKYDQIMFFLNRDFILKKKVKQQKTLLTKTKYFKKSCLNV